MTTISKDDGLISAVDPVTVATGEDLTRLHGGSSLGLVFPRARARAITSIGIFLVNASNNN